MPHVLDQGVYGPSATRNSVGMDWLAWSKDLSETKRELLARFTPDTFPSSPRPIPARYIVASIQPGAVFAAKSELFDYKMPDGSMRPAWVTHFLFDFPPEFQISEILALEAARIWLGPADNKAMRKSLQQVGAKELRRYIYEARPLTTHQLDAIIERALTHLEAGGPDPRICMATRDLDLLPRCMLTLSRAAERRRPPIKIDSVSTYEDAPLRTPFMLTGAPPQARQRLQADRRFVVIDLDASEIVVGGRPVWQASSPVAPEPTDDDSIGEGGDRGSDKTEVATRQTVEGQRPLDATNQNGGQTAGQRKRGSFLPTKLTDALADRLRWVTSSDRTAPPAPSPHIADPPPTSMPAIPTPPPRPTVAQLLGQIAAIAGASDEAQRVEAAIGAYLADAPIEERHVEIAKTIDALAELKDAGDQRAKARLIGMLLGKEPKALLTDRSSGTIDRIFRDLESQDRAILLRAGLGRLDGETAQAPLIRRIADVFVQALEKGRDAVAARTPEANNLRLALDAIGQSAVDDAGLKLRAMRLLDWALLQPGGDAPLRVLARTVPREVEELRGELKRTPSPEEALARLDKDFSLAQGLGTQLKVEALLLLLAANLESPCAKVFAALLPYAQQVPGLHDTARAIATGPLQLGTWNHLLAEADVAELRALFEERFPGELPRAAAG